MKKRAKRLASAAKSVFNNRVFRTVALVLISVALGFMAGRVYYNSPGKNTAKKDMTRTAPTRSREELVKSRIEKARTAVSRDLKANKLTQQQADTLRKKIDELSESMKQNGYEPLDRAKRKELRDWAKQQSISTRYLMYLY